MPSEGTVKVGHISYSLGSFERKFIVSEVGSLRIATFLQPPLLSVVFPGSDKAPLILSDKHKRSVPFVMINPWGISNIDL